MNKIILGTFFKNLRNKRIVLIFSIIIFSIISFEALQEHYHLTYLKQFGIIDENRAEFFKLLKGQLRRWLIWSVLFIVLIRFIKKEVSKHELTINDYLRYFFVIIAFVLLNIILISIVELLLSNYSFTFSNLFKEFLPYFIFRKSLIFLLSYIISFLILFYYFQNLDLKLKIEEISTLKGANELLTEKLEINKSELHKVINIKVGNTRKIVPILEIFWIEADDYCVIVHTKEKSFTARNPLKAFEEEFDAPFIRVHRRAIVNMSKVKEVSFSNKPMLILEDDTTIFISQRKLKTVKAFYNQYKSY
ncbi:LytTR family DNA-binding domain-containing protein [uncultured Psychroserpens sp.]|uniref:LytR/AlgR family response regulator transcription factor n=1 Tax=uncultured Psychroserpens sp. TaxID=255436 RepID=UPI002623B992|nr:LytTR family DNA-binding domain-containing protein [uncultured Psychroserpens sp.]